MPRHYDNTDITANTIVSPHGYGIRTARIVVTSRSYHRYRIRHAGQIRIYAGDTMNTPRYYGRHCIIFHAAMPGAAAPEYVNRRGHTQPLTASGFSHHAMTHYITITLDIHMTLILLYIPHITIPHELLPPLSFIITLHHSSIIAFCHFLHAIAA